MLLGIHVYRMVSSPMRAYGAPLVVVVAAVSGVVVPSGFVTIDFVPDMVAVWDYVAAAGVMIAYAVVSWLTDSPGILSSESGSEGQ